jgi:hypothetical protein
MTRKHTFFNFGFIVFLVCVSSQSFGFKVQPLILTNTPAMMRYEKATPMMCPREDGLRQSTEKGKFEWWYFDADLDDGSKVVVVFFAKSITGNSGALKPRVEITFTRPGGTAVMDWNEYSPAEFFADTQKCDVKISDNTVSGNLETYTLHAAGKTLQADLEFHRVVPSWRTGAGKIYFDQKLSKCMGWVVPSPLGFVRGNVTWPEGMKAVAGTGYHDHNWGNYPIEKVFDYWIWGRASVGDYTFLFFNGVGSKKWGHKHVPIFMMAKKDAILIPEATHYTLSWAEVVRDTVKHGRRYPKKLFVNLHKDSLSASLTFSNPNVIERDDLLVESVPKWVAPFVRPFVNPWYFRFDAALDATVSVGSVKENISGKSIYELMLFGDARDLH